MLVMATGNLQNGQKWPYRTAMPKQSGGAVLPFIGPLVGVLVATHAGGSLGGDTSSEGVAVVGREVAEKPLENPAEKFAQQGCGLIGREGLRAFLRLLLI